MHCTAAVQQDNNSTRVQPWIVFLHTVTLNNGKYIIIRAGLLQSC